MDINGFFPMLNHRNVCIVRYFLHNLIMDKYIFLFVKEHFSTTGLDIPPETFSSIKTEIFNTTYLDEPYGKCTKTSPGLELYVISNVLCVSIQEIYTM